MDNFYDIVVRWSHNQTLIRITVLGICMVIIMLINHFVLKMLNRTINDNSNKYRARKAVNVISYLLVASTLVFVFNDKLGNIGMALGLAGAGIAFALQEVIVSLAGWFNIVLAGTVSVGQRVKIGDVKGDIIDIGVFNTTIMETGDWVNGDLYNGRLVTLSNSFIFKEKVHNYSAEYPFLWDEIQIPINSETDHDKAREIFLKTLNDICGDYARQSKKQWLNLTNKYRVEEAQVEPMISMEFNENWIIFTLRYIVDFKKRRSTKDAIFSQILKEIKGLDGQVKIAASTLEVTYKKSL